MMTMLLACIAGISLLVGGIGIMNIMYVSVTHPRGSDTEHHTDQSTGHTDQNRLDQELGQNIPPLRSDRAAVFCCTVVCGLYGDGNLLRLVSGTESF